MIVTQIKELNKTKSKIYIDNEFAFVLYKGEIYTYKLEENKQIAEETYHTIIHSVLPKRAKLRCMNLLKTREYTTEQLRRKLKEGYYPADIIEEAIMYVASYHYIDDERYARDYITYHLEDKSKKRIENDLLLKGITKDLIEKVYLELEENGVEDYEEEQIQKFLQKKGYQIENEDYRTKQKIIGALYRKGFSLDKIYKVLDASDV